MTQPPSETRALEDVLASADALSRAPLGERLAWLERAADAASNVDLGERGAEGALSLRAALGAIVKFAHSEQSADGLAELDVVVRTLFSRAQLALTGALADHYDTLAEERATGAWRDACRALALAYRELARAVRRGEPVGVDVAARVREVRDAWERAAREPPPG